MRKLVVALVTLSLSGMAAGVHAQTGADPFARARADIAVYCRGDRACETGQREQLGHFVTMMAGFRDPGSRNAEQCMRGGLEGRHVNWVKAAACMREAVSGRRIGQ